MIRVVGNLSSVAGMVVHFTIWARDCGRPLKESQSPALVSIEVTKRNLLAPKFSSNHYSVKFLLPTVIGVKIFCVSASDPDDERPQLGTRRFGKHQSSDVRRTEIHYSFSRKSSSQHLFSLDKFSGCVYVREERGLRGTTNLTILASDRTFSSSSLLTISVSDSDELLFTETIYRANVLENSTKETNLLVVSLKNLPVNKHIIYTILNPTKFLKVHPTSGVLQTTGIPFDREERDIFAVIVQVW